jgi:hypothetical protein
MVSGHIYNPDIPLGIQMDPVGEIKLPGTKTGEDLAGITIKLENRINQILSASTTQSTRATSIISPDVTVMRIDINTGRRTPCPIIRKRAPF